jgi:Glu-tRNA(Gln) amidotransferase subunit E-like FAD-binding protein
MDYRKIGFKSGLEIHQQLDTRKLFCNCPSVLRKDEPDFKVERKLHAVAGESGEVDVAAQYQASLDKKFIYQGYDSTCLVELDEEPPHQINEEALKIAVQVAIFLNTRVLPITQIMRKTVIDGSNTSGFQRTVLVALDGFVETSSGRVGIDAVILEEDAARIVSQNDEENVYRLDRLGVPLIEVVTAPDIKNPEHAKEVALKIGDILRSLKVKRGLGTIRQDVSISIKGSSRVEIKGLQEPKLIIPTIDSEIKRLQGVKNHEPEVRKSNPDATTSFLRPLPGSARMYPETDLPLLKIPRDFINRARKDIPRLRSDIERELLHEGLSEEMVKVLFKRNMLEEFRELHTIAKSPSLTGKVLFVFPKEIAARENKSLDKIENILTIDVMKFILKEFAKKKIDESQVKQALERVAKGEEFEKSVEFEKADTNAVEEFVMKIVKEKPGMNPNAYMGLVMKEFAGKVSGGEVMETIKKYVGDK